MESLDRIWLENLGGSGSGGEGAGSGARVKPSAELRRSARHSHTAAYFIARNHGSKKPFAIDFACASNECVRGRYGFRAGVDDANAVKIIHFETVNQCAIGERRVGARDLSAVAPDECSLSLTHLLGKRSNDLSPGQSRAKESAAKRIDDAELNVRDYFLGEVSIGESRYVLGQYLSRRVPCSNFFSMLFRHKNSLTRVQPCDFSSARRRRIGFSTDSIVRLDICPTIPARLSRHISREGP